MSTTTHFSPVHTPPGSRSLAEILADERALYEARRKPCRECGAVHAIAGANQPARMGDLFLAFSSEGLHTAADVMRQQIEAHDTVNLR